MAMHLFPENVRVEDIPHSEDEGAASATADKGRQLSEKTVEGVVELLEGMIAGSPDASPTPSLNIPKR